MMREGAFERAYPMILRAVAPRAAAGHLGPWDREDAEQQAALGVWRALPRFDPVRGCLKTFVECVTRNELVSAFRNSGEPLLPHESLDGLESIFVAPDSRLDLRVDVDRAIESVAPFDQAVALSLMDASVIEASHELKVTRAATYRAIGRIREAFTSAGFGCTRVQPCGRGAKM